MGPGKLPWGDIYVGLREFAAIMRHNFLDVTLIKVYTAQIWRGSLPSFDLFWMGFFLFLISPYLFFAAESVDNDFILLCDWFFVHLFVYFLKLEFGILHLGIKGK